MWVIRKGFDISIDGDFGAATELAVMTLQKNNSLVKDGIVGQKTWDALRAIEDTIKWLGQVCTPSNLAVISKTIDTSMTKVILVS